MSRPGVYYMINGIGVTSPDDERWEPISVGDAVDGLQRRSPYYRLTWNKNRVEKCDLDWFQFDNTSLAQLICRPPDELAEYEVYTEAYCQSVVMKHHLSLGTDITATFLVRVN